jgi:hypothetical protein
MSIYPEASQTAGTPRGPRAAELVAVVAFLSFLPSLRAGYGQQQHPRARHLDDRRQLAVVVERCALVRRSRRR